MTISLSARRFMLNWAPNSCPPEISKTFIHDTGIKIVSSNETSLYEAGRAWKTYLDRRKHGLICPACGKRNKAVCSSCGKTISSRQHVLSDFLIGAHAKIQADRFITRDRGFYRTCFQGLNIFHPELLLFLPPPSPTPCSHGLCPPSFLCSFTPLVPRLRLGMHTGRLCLPFVKVNCHMTLMPACTQKPRRSL